MTRPLDVLLEHVSPKVKAAAAVKAAYLMAVAEVPDVSQAPSQSAARDRACWRSDRSQPPAPGGLGPEAALKKSVCIASPLSHKCFLERRSTERSTCSLLVFDHLEKVVNWRSIEELEEKGFHFGLLVKTWKREVLLSLRMRGKIQDRQPYHLLRLGVDPHQKLIRQLIAGSRSGLPKCKRQEVSLWD